MGNKGVRTKQNMKKLMMTAAVAAIACGCITNHKNDGGDACLKPAIAKDIVHEKYSVEKNPVTAAESINYLQIGPLSFTWGGTATHFADCVPIGKVNEYFGYTPQQEAQNGAFANACDQAKCDNIVGARYKYTNEKYFIYGKVTCEATGYPAKLTGVELIENKTPCCCK